MTTRPVSAKKLIESEIWKKGPEWLKNKEQWKNETEKYNLFPETNESEWEVDSNLTQVKVINLLGHTTGEIQNKELS